jgi:hypothetical protein
MLFMARIGDSGQNILKSMDAAKVLWRTSSGTGEAARIDQSVLQWLLAFINQRMLPIIAEVVHIQRWRSMVAAMIKDLRHKHMPTRTRDLLSHFFIARNPH